jgi:hypothetical protein
MENLFQTRVKNFEDEILPFKNFIANTQLKSLIEFNNTFFDGFRTLGVGELWARQYERQSKLQSLIANAEYSQSQFKRYNILGIQRINDALGKLKEAASEFNAVIKPDDVKKIENKLKEQIDEFKLQCTDLEIKGSDVDKLFNSVDKLFDSFQVEGSSGVINVMEKSIQELISLRNSDNRGAIENFPIWKVAAIIIGIGVWIIAFIHCGFFNCSVSAGTAYFIIFLIAAIVVRFC